MEAARCLPFNTSNGTATREAPPAVFRIDILVFNNVKTPLVFLPRYQNNGCGPIAADASRTYKAIEGLVKRLTRHSTAPVVHALDIGANVGDTTLLYAAAVTGETIAIEMAPKTFGILDFFAEANPSLRIRPYNVAFGPEDGEVSYQDSGGNAKVQASGASDAKAQMREPMRFLTSLFDADFLDHIGFVKIDTEGHDVGIARLIMPLLLRARPLLQVEWFDRKCGQADTGPQIFALAEEIGYSVRDPMSGVQIRRPSSCNKRTALDERPHDLLLVPEVLV